MLRATVLALSRRAGKGALARVSATTTSTSALTGSLSSSTTTSMSFSGSAVAAAAATSSSRRVAARAAKTTASDSSLSDKARAVDSVMKDINARFGKGSIMYLGGEPEKMETISTGALTLDVALGGGLPKGRIVEVYGPESSGKTTIALHAIAEVQKKGGRAALIDAEHAFDPVYAAALGIKLPKLLISQPESGEMALEIVDQLVRSDSFDLIAVDSVAALTPKAELEGEIGQATIGLQARLLSAALRKVAANASKSGTTILMLNQLRMKIGVMYGNPEVTPGGNALKFYASARVDVRRKAALDPPSGSSSSSSGLNAGVSPGIRVRAKVVKNKCAPPYRVAEFDILFNGGINNTGCVLEAAEAVGVVERKGAWFYLSSDGSRLGQGKEKASAALEADPKLRKKVEEETRARLDGRMAKKGGGAVVPTASIDDDEEGGGGGGEFGGGEDDEEEEDAVVGAASVSSPTLEAASAAEGLSSDEASDAAA